MGEKTGISWAHHTFNPWIGCTKYAEQGLMSEACRNCYAEALDARWGYTPEGWGKGKPRARTSKENWLKPVTWHKAAARARKCAGCGHEWRAALETSDWTCVKCGRAGLRPQRRVFCASLADWLDDEVPVEWLGDLMARIHETPYLTWLLLSKRVRLWRERMELLAAMGIGSPGSGYARNWLDGIPPRNVWMGATVESQGWANRRIPVLLEIPAVARFLSVEPMLEAVDLAYAAFNGADAMPGLYWVIVGGESGRAARPMHPDWVRDLRDQCSRAGVAFHFKQWGEWLPEDHGGRGKHSIRFSSGVDMRTYRVGVDKAGRLLDGREWNGVPWDGAWQHERRAP